MDDVGSEWRSLLCFYRFQNHDSPMFSDVEDALLHIKGDFVA